MWTKRLAASWQSNGSTGAVENIAPVQKYQHPALSYAALAAAILGMPDGETQVAELVRRLSVNELLGNYDIT